MKDSKITHPKVFISYSWTPSENRKSVIDLAHRLNDSGIDVIIDEWYLRPGMDIYSFMEKMVTDDTIDKILIICNHEYMVKANSIRGSGVDIERQIISKELYLNADENKFIPVIFEHRDGKPCLPAYLDTKLNIDFSNEKLFHVAYEQLVREIYGKPINSRPKSLGNIPPYIKGEVVQSFPEIEIYPSWGNRKASFPLMKQDILNSENGIFIAGIGIRSITDVLLDEDVLKHIKKCLCTRYFKIHIIACNSVEKTNRIFEREQGKLQEVIDEGAVLLDLFKAELEKLIPVKVRKKKPDYLKIKTYANGIPPRHFILKTDNCIYFGSYLHNEFGLHSYVVKVSTNDLIKEEYQGIYDLFDCEIEFLRKYCVDEYFTTEAVSYG